MSRFGNTNGLKHGQHNTRAYRAWRAMKTRCNNPNIFCASYYSGSGITYDPRWEKFENFLEDMGHPPEGLTLERIDNANGYSKDNCCWANRKAQANNRRNSHWITIDGETKTLQQWAEYFGIHNQIARVRISKGWCDHCAVSIPKYSGTCIHVKEN